MRTSSELPAIAHTAKSSVPRVVREAVIGALGLVTVALVVAPSTPGASVGHPHLMWLVVLVFAAQYGTRGLLAGLAASVIGLATASLVVGEGLDWLTTRVTDGAELMAFAGTIVVAWISAGHERRKQQLAAAQAAQTAEAVEARVAFRELRTIADGLARQTDRADLSVSYLRSVAERIEGADPVASADAAIELAMVRIGARAGAVLIHDGTRLRLVAHRGAWTADNLIPPDVFHDRTAELAFHSGRTASGLQLPAIADLDSDVAAPIIARDGSVCGALVVRGLGFDLGLAHIGRLERTLYELAAIGKWVGRPHARAMPAPTPAPETSSGYSYSFRAGERRDVIAWSRAANDGTGRVA